MITTLILDLFLFALLLMLLPVIAIYIVGIILADAVIHRIIAPAIRTGKRDSR